MKMKLKSVGTTPTSISAAAILATVPKPASLVAVEERLAPLRAEREQLMGTIRSLANQRGDREVDRRLVALHQQREALEDQIRQARRRRAELLEPYAKQLADRLAPTARDTGGRIIAAAAELNAALTAAAEIVDAGMLRMAVPGVYLDEVESFARRLADLP